jgi:hypothetical protein
MALMVYVGLTRSDRESRVYSASVIAVFVSSIAVLGKTGVWEHHLQLLAYPQILSLSIGIPLLLLKLRTWHVNIFALLALAAAASGHSLATGFDGYRFNQSGREPELLMGLRRSYTRLKGIIAAAPPFSSPPYSPGQNLDYFKKNPAGGEFSVLSHGGRVIPNRSIDVLRCPDFQQYAFYSKERLEGIQRCALDSKYLIIDKNFTPWKELPSLQWWPVDADRSRLMENWNFHVASTMKEVENYYLCTTHKQGLLCEKISQQAGL